ncbi:MAG: LptF/LptG family permease [Sphingomonadales bacterium]
MTGILARYLSTVTLRHYAAFALASVAGATLIGFLENRDGLLDDPSVGMLEGLKYSALSAPGMFSLLAGFIALMAVLIAAVTLLRQSELKALLAAGLGHGQLALALAPAAVLIFGFHFMMENVVLPRSSAELRAWGVGKTWRHQPGETEAIWTRDGRYIVAIRDLRRSDRTLVGLDLFAMGAAGDLEWHASAPTARIENGYLRAPAGNRTVVATLRTAPVHGLRVPTTLDFDTLALLAPHPARMSAWDIARVLGRSGPASHPRHLYWLWLQRKLAAPLTAALAVFLLVPLVERLHRIGATRTVLAGLAAGFCYFVGDGILTGMAEAGLIRTAIAAWAMPAMLALLIALAARGARRPG